MSKKINAALQQAKKLLYDLDEQEGLNGVSAPYSGAAGKSCTEGKSGVGENSRIEGKSRKAGKIADLSLEEVARRLIKEFLKSEDRRYFNLFYSLTREIFYAYAFSHTYKLNNAVDPEDVLNRLYLLVFQKLLSSSRNLPIDYLFPWCFKAMQNLAREEARALAKAKKLAAKADPPPEPLSPMELLLAKEERRLDELKILQVLELLFSAQSGLSDRDRRIMRMYYLEGRTMREISRVIDLAITHISVILMRSRRRIARRLSWMENRSLH